MNRLAFLAGSISFIAAPVAGAEQRLAVDFAPGHRLGASTPPSTVDSQ